MRLFEENASIDFALNRERRKIYLQELIQVLYVPLSC